MSDTYNFLSLSDTEEMAEPADGTMALVLDEGAVKRVPASQFGGSGVGSYIVNVTIADGSTFTADKTVAEILAAIESGAVPVAVVDITALTGDTFILYLPLLLWTAENGVDGFVFASETTNLGVNSVTIVAADGGDAVDVELGLLG